MAHCHTTCTSHSINQDSRLAASAAAAETGACGVKSAVPSCGTAIDRASTSSSGVSRPTSTSGPVCPSSSFFWSSSSSSSSCKAFEVSRPFCSYTPTARHHYHRHQNYRNYSATITAFLPRDAMLARYMLSLCTCLSVSVYLSVCHKPALYQNGPKRQNIGSRKQRYTIAQGSYSFMTQKISAKFQRHHPLRGAM